MPSPHLAQLGVLVLQEQQVLLKLLQLRLSGHLLQLQLLPRPLLSLQVGLQLLQQEEGEGMQGLETGRDGKSREGADSGLGALQVLLWAWAGPGDQTLSNSLCTHWLHRCLSSAWHVPGTALDPEPLWVKESPCPGTQGRHAEPHLQPLIYFLYLRQGLMQLLQLSTNLRPSCLNLSRVVGLQIMYHQAWA